MITVDVDIATCFPSYEQNDGSLTKFDEGVPVHLIEAIASLNHDAKASIKVGPCRYTEPMRMSVGTVEGGVDSCRNFTTQVTPLLRDLRTCPEAARIGPKRVGVVTHMDDLKLLPRSRADTTRMLNMTAEWMYARRR